MFKYSFLSSIIILVIACYFYFYPKHMVMESFNASQNPEIILLGDSILNNKNYVFVNESVEYYLKQKYPIVKNLAKDGSKMDDLYDQIDHLKTIPLSKHSKVIISIGGNDLLENQNPHKLLEQYKEILLHLLKTYPGLKIYIVNIYYPPCCRFKKYVNVITNWNNLLGSLNQLLNSNIKIIPISEVVTERNDFVFEIEPSPEGGQKIVDSIISYL